MSHLFAPSRCAHLPQTKDFQRPDPNLSVRAQTELSYKRARAIAREYAMTAHDVLTLSDKFWELHTDNIVALDGGAMTLLTIQYNLAAGTLAPFAIKRPELRPLLQRILAFDVSAQFLLTEVAHGLDAENVETTATLLPDGAFDLHTPNAGAAKHMPPVTPYGGIPRVGIVIARLMVNGEDRGLRPFIVALGDGEQMCKGITSRVLPRRAGAKSIDHALTSFTHVRLAHSALLGTLVAPADVRGAFTACIRRVHIGTLALSTLAVPAVAVAVHIAARYSARRIVAGGPIWAFRTQQLPVLHALAQVYVMKAYARVAACMFADARVDPRVRMGVAAAAKAVMIQHVQASLFALSERCGAQGLFEHNQIIATQLDARGAGIAEGDVLVLCIRLATELLLGRYEMPAPHYPDSLLARHEAGLFAECRARAAALGAHRSDAFNRTLLPLCQPLIEAVGHRMAYEAAIAARVPPHLLALYESGAVQRDAAWYAEHGALGRAAQVDAEEAAASAALPLFERDLAALHAAPFAVAPIVSQERWDAFVGELEVFAGVAEVEFVAPSEEPRDVHASDVQAHL